MRTRQLSVVLVSVLLVASGVGVGAVGASLSASLSGADADSAGAAASVAGTAPAQAGSNIGGSPDLDVFAPNPNLVPGRTNEVTLQIANDGNFRFGNAANSELVTTARDVRVDVEASGPLSVESGETSIGSVTTSAPGELPVSLNVPQDVDPGTYTLDLDLTYGYISSGESRTVTVSRDVDVRVRDDARFRVVGVETDAQVGDSGMLTVELENTGSEPATEADVRLTSAAGVLTFGGTGSSTARIAELAPGETAAVTYDVEVAPNSAVRSYVVTGRVAFKDPDGIRRTDETISLGVRPQAEQRFSIGNVSADLRVGEDGDVYGTVTNDGPATARNVVVQYAEESPSLIPVEESVAVGTLEPGASADFRLPLAVSGEAEAVARTADVAVQYRNAEMERRSYQDLELLFDIAPERDRFDVAVADRTIQAGGERTISVEVTNNLDEEVSDVEARLFADDPVATGDTDTGYAQSIAPGESVTMTFDLSATGSATPGSTYPISFDFRYDDADGNSQLSDTVRVPIDVTESEGGGLPLPALAVVLLVVVAGAAVYYRRRE